MRIITCTSGYGDGGIGQHFAQLVEETRAENRLKKYYAPGIKPGDDFGQHFEHSSWALWLRRYTPIQYSPAWRTYVTSMLFDRRLANHLDVVSNCFMGIAGASLHSFRRASELGAQQLELFVPTAHVNRVWRRYEQAYNQTGIKDTWLNSLLYWRKLKEYETADIIFVPSEYVRRSFLEEGIPASKLRRNTLKVDPRFKPPTSRPSDKVFRVVYTGDLTAVKGIPLLVKAFSRLSGKAELTLVGDYYTPAMREYLEQQMALDGRIHLAPGDPLPALHRSDVYVHPSFQDGFGYAPMEALSCDLPVIVTEDTGMKEYVKEGENGFVVPTGSWKAILDRLNHLR